MKKRQILSYISLLGLTLLSLVHYMDNAAYWLIDFFSHFIFQYALLALVLMFIFFRQKKFFLAVMAGFLFVFNMAAITNWGETTHAADQTFKTPNSFKVYSANIYKDNMELSKLNLEIQKINPEIVLLLEVEPGHIEQLRSIMQAYPYRLKAISAESVGFVFLSKFPVYSHHVTKLSKFGNLLLRAKLDINHKPVIFYGLHAQRPRLRNGNERIDQLLRIARQIKEQSLPVIVAGDFNTTPYTPIFREVVKISGLKDSREGFGWQPTWPTFFPPLWMPIDHVLVSPDIQVRQRKTGSYIGSDHYPVIVEFTLG